MHFDICCAKSLEPIARNQFVWILHRNKYFLDASLHERIRTGRSFAVMGTRFERNVRNAAFSRIARIGQRVDFRMRFSGLLMPAFANDLTVPCQDASNPRIRMCAEHSAARQG